MWTRIIIKDSNHGGSRYEKLLGDLFTDHIKTKELYERSKTLTLLNYIKYVLISFTSRRTSNNIVNIHTVFAASSKGKNILILHHIDIRHTNLLFRLYQTFAWEFIKLYRKRFFKIIVVSKYWHEFMSRRGFRNVEVIYNSFDLEEFKFRPDHKNDFFSRFKLNPDLPLIYLGTNKSRKGVEHLGEVLDNNRYNLICTGWEDGIKTAKTRTLQLNRKDYLNLLVLSDLVILNSQFLEGWNRVLHEASLLGTTVLARPSGGMTELINMAAQLSFQGTEDLIEIVEQTLITEHKPDQIQLKKLNLEYFKNKWENIIINSDV